MGARVAKGLGVLLCAGAVATSCTCRRTREQTVAPIPASELHDAVPSSAPRTFLERFPLRLHTRWIDHVEAKGAPTSDPIEEIWLPVDATSWDVVVRSVPDAGPDDLAKRFAARPEGILAIGTRFREKYDPYDSPTMWLPSDARIGLTWKEHHDPPAQPRERSCRIEGHAACDGGLAVVCVSTYDTGESSTSTHLFCERIGWIGYTLVTTDVDGKTIVERRRSDDVRDVP